MMSRIGVLAISELDFSDYVENNRDSGHTFLRAISDEHLRSHEYDALHITDHFHKRNPGLSLYQMACTRVRPRTKA